MQPEMQGQVVSLWNTDFAFLVQVGVLLVFVAGIYANIQRVLNPLVQGAPVKTMIVLGSGGHTKEMLTLVKGIDIQIYTPRIYVVAHSDLFSREKAIAMETERNAEVDSYSFETVHRIREVGQGWLSTFIFSLPRSLTQSIQCVFRHRPNLLLCNGPGICVPFCYTMWYFKNLGIVRGSTTFVESICRVNSLSLSGRMVRRSVDYFLVQWQELAEMYRDVKYIGRLS